MAKKFGILGGAFDPIHQGHIHIAELARQELALDKVYFLPLGIAVHKDQPQHSAEQRLKLIRNALETQKNFAVLTLDIERNSPSYAVDTLTELKKQPDFTDADLYYIIGIDAFEQIFTWKDPAKLFTLVRFVVVFRPGYNFFRIEQMFAERESFLDQIYLIEDSGVNVSSTQIREQAVD
ncbi:nicotinate nucleotide adenylyltransferase [Candidatus Termititenax dinenymphae]|uniref:Probable nicotinate-nucleotide adenylyltransferase n=1 Tax=Candidatus Termititenax dinenymphae TaxID=2218523 RepID=A0A388TLD1_9BACT|nr:nicotinate nucleotide adenylyltransferase [Candidatus Termititenax dinenymphae]